MTMGFSMGHSRKEMKNLKKKFYKLKQTKIPTVIQSNMKNNIHTTQGQKSDRKRNKRLEKENFPRRFVSIMQMSKRDLGASIK